MTARLESSTDVAAILDRLREARTAAANAAGSSGSVATMTFVVFVDDAAHRPWVLERAAQIVEKHPARLLVLDSTPGARGAEASAVARTQGSLEIVGERVDLGVDGLAHGEVISVVRSLTISDVPTALWWTAARLLSSRTFSGLVELASTVVIDSSGSVGDSGTLGDVAAFATRFPAVTLHDLAYMRLAPWREMIAQFFDEPALRDDLFTIDALEIASGSAAEGLYLAGWLGSRISWEPRGRGFEARGRAIRFDLVARGDRRRVLAVVLRAGEAVYRAEISDDDPDVACLTIEGRGERPMWCVPLRDVANTSLIERAILESGRDLVFDTTLETVRGLLA